MCALHDDVLAAELCGILSPCFRKNVESSKCDPLGDTPRDRDNRAMHSFVITPRGLEIAWRSHATLVDTEIAYLLISRVREDADPAALS
jgi:hypothetical protein